MECKKEFHGKNSADAKVDTMGKSPMDNRSSMSVKDFVAYIGLQVCIRHIWYGFKLSKCFYMQESVANVQLVVVHLFGWVGKFFMGQKNCFCCSILSGFYVQNCSRWIFIVTHWSDKEILERYHEIFFCFSQASQDLSWILTHAKWLLNPRNFFGASRDSRINSRESFSWECFARESW